MTTTPSPPPCPEKVHADSATAPVAAPALLADLGPWAQVRAGRLGRRVPQLLGGLALYGFSLGLVVEGAHGLAPWDVMHSGIALWVPLTLGQVIVVMSFVVLLAWIPLREKPGIGTLANAFLVGLGLDATTALLPDTDSLPVGLALVVAGVVLNGLATALYIGAQLGRGPRDGLMTGLSRTTGFSLRVVRTGLEVAVVVVGLLLGGTLGVGTVLYALAIGPLTQAFLPYVAVPLRLPEPVSDASR